MTTTYLQIASYVVPALVILGILYLTVVRDIRTALDDSLIRAHIKDETGHIRRFIAKIRVAKDVETITVGDHDYGVKKDRVYRTGLFRVPTSYYLEGQYEPLYFAREQPTNDKLSSDYNKVSHHRVVTQLLDAFRESFLTPEMSVIVIAVVVLVAAGGIYWTTGQRFDELEFMLMQIAEQGNNAVQPVQSAR